MECDIEEKPEGTMGIKLRGSLFYNISNRKLIMYFVYILYDLSL